MSPPLARNDLVIRDLEDEAVVYDFSRNQAHCLNASALAVWRRCDGKTTAAAIARALELDLPWVEHALQQLSQSHLLCAPIDLGRRRLLKKMALTAGLSIAVPAVWSIVAPTPAYAASTVVCVPPLLCAVPVTCCGSSGGAAMSCAGVGSLSCTGNAPGCAGKTCQ